MDLAQNQLRRGRRGYSLVELLLTMSLLLLFTGLAVVSLNTLNQRSMLAEGTVRFETLLRFARAEAAHSGKRVRINFVQDTNQVPTTAQLGTNAVDPAQFNHVELTWEPDPASQPDVFQDLQTIQWGVEQVNETVWVPAIRLVDNADSQPAADEPGEPGLAEASPQDASAAAVPSITFNPNGSCDSAEITLADREGKEDRRVIVRVEGFTGLIWRLDPAEKEAGATADAQPSSGLSGPPENRQFN
jgi:prepilin-type N-terminal cleavage/methylation domain-containing protein